MNETGNNAVFSVENRRKCTRWTWVALLAILFVTIALRVLYGLEYAGRPEYRHLTFDALYHDYWAKALVTGRWEAPGTELDPEIQSHPYFRPPGYPFALAAIYAVTDASCAHAPMLVQMALGVLSVMVAFYIGRCWWSATLGLFWAAAMAATWSFPFFEGELLEPALLVFLGLCLVGVLAYWTEGRFWIPGLVAGFIFGAYALVRPNALLLGPVILGWGVWVAHRTGCLPAYWKGACAFMLAAGVLILPVTLRNYRMAGEWVLISANGGVNLYCGNNPTADGYSPGAPEITAWNSFDYPHILKNLPSQPGMSYTAASREFSKRALAYAWRQPSEVLALWLRKTLLFWGPYEVGNNKDDELERQASAVLRNMPLTFAWAHAGFWLGLCMLFWGRGKNDPPAPTGAERRGTAVAVLMGLLALGLFATYLPFIIAGRYRVPILPFLLFFGAYALQSIVCQVRARQWRSAGFWLLAGAGLAGLAHLNLAGYIPDRAGFLYGRGRAYACDGQVETAQQFFRQAAAADPQFAPKLTRMAQLLAERGREEEALCRLRHALAGNPGYINAYLVMATLLERMDCVGEAQVEIRRALEWYPDATALRATLEKLEKAASKQEAAQPALEPMDGL